MKFRKLRRARKQANAPANTQYEPGQLYSTTDTEKLKQHKRTLWLFSTLCVCCAGVFLVGVFTSFPGVFTFIPEALTTACTAAVALAVPFAGAVVWCAKRSYAAFRNYKEERDRKSFIPFSLQP